MPYIKPDQRPKLDGIVNHMEKNRMPRDKGELNYLISSLIVSYMQDKGKSYATLSDVSGVLSDVSNEFYRRVVVPYENEKIALNGDVFTAGTKKPS